MKPSVFSPGHFRIAPATFSVSGPRFKSVENYFFPHVFFPLFSLSARLVLAWVQSLAEPTFFLSLFFFFFLSFFPLLHFFFPHPFLSYSNFFLPFSPACLPSSFLCRGKDKAKYIVCQNGRSKSSLICQNPV